MAFVMVVEAKLRVRHRGCFSERLLGAAQGAQLSSDPEADVFALHGPDSHALESLLHAPQSVSRTPTSLVARVHGARHAVPAAIAAGGCTVVWPIVLAGGEELVTVLAPSPERLDAVLLSLRALGAVVVERVVETPASQLRVSVPVTDITTDLTERQLIVLQTAIAEGYYDSPRRTSTEALASTFGVTRSTLEEHLRKAERRVLEGFARILIAQPVLARAAARRPGRPAAKPVAR